METVKQFGNELNSIRDFRPPVSKAKMASITKLAMKSHKYYKHIVMLVEKFISKSGSEYKIPGLYVIDSIMRQSKHQYGAKDSFGPRFTKNFEKTFLHLYQCPEEDRPKIVRVLNLWQKNEVFPSDVIQPLLALASSDDPSQLKHSERHRDMPQFDKEWTGDSGPHPLMGEPLGGRNEGVTTNLDLDTATTIIQQQQEQISALLQQQQQLQSQATSLLAPAFSGVLAQQQQVPSGGVQQLEAISSLLQQTQQLQQLQAMQQRLANGDEVGGAMGGVPAQISNMEPVAHNPQPALFNEAVLDDFDYSDEEDTLDRASQLVQQKERETMNHPQPPPLQPLIPLSNDSVSPMESPHRKSKKLSSPEPLFPPKDAHHYPLPPEPVPLPPITQSKKEAHPYNREMGGVNPPLPPIPDQFSPAPPPVRPNYPPPPHGRGPPPPQIPPPGPPGPPREWPRQHPPPLPPHYPPPPRSPSPRMRRESRFSPPPPLLGRRSPSPHHHRPPWRERGERGSRWSSPPPPRRRSRSPPMLMRRGSRDRSRSPPHSRWHRAATPPENQERRRKGIPFPRDKHMTVCSKTLWVGHLSKHATKETVKQAFEDFGQIKSVELIHSRGCAYLVMMHRNDAIRALNSLRDLKLGGTTCKLAWAPGRGVKGAGLKAFWDQEVGSSYIPWTFVKSQADVNSMGDGGWIDGGTLPPGVTLPPAEEETTEEEDVEPPAAPPAQPESMQPQPPLPPVQNIQPPSLPPQQSVAPAPAVPPQPPIPSFPQLMNPTAPFQPPGEAIQHFPPRGVPNSQPVPVQQPPFSQPPPFHGGIRPPMGGGEPQPNMPQQLHRPPMGVGGIPHSMAPPMGGVPHSMAPPMGGVPHSMAPPMGGVPHSMAPPMGGVPHSMAPPMGGIPQHPNLPPTSQGQMPIHRPQMMPPHPHGMPPRSTPHQMVQQQTGNVRPFLPHMAPMVSPVSQNFPHPREPSVPMRPFMPMEQPHGGHPMAPHMGEGPRPPFTHQPPYPPIGHQGDQPVATLNNQPPMRPLLPPSQGQILPQDHHHHHEEPQDSSLEPVPMDEESTEPIPMDEEPKDHDSSNEAEEPKEPESSKRQSPSEPLPPPPMGEGPKEPLLPHMNEEPNEPIVPPEDKEPEVTAPLMGEGQTKPLDMRSQDDSEPPDNRPMGPSQTKSVSPEGFGTVADDHVEPLPDKANTDQKPPNLQPQVTPIGGEEPQRPLPVQTEPPVAPQPDTTAEQPEKDNSSLEQPSNSCGPVDTIPPVNQTVPQETTPLPKDEERRLKTNGEGPLETKPLEDVGPLEQEESSDKPLATNPEPNDKNEPNEDENRAKRSNFSDDDMQIETTYEEDFRIATMADDSDFL